MVGRVADENAVHPPGVCQKATQAGIGGASGISHTGLGFSNGTLYKKDKRERISFVKGLKMRLSVWHEGNLRISLGRFSIHQNVYL